MDWFTVAWATTGKAWVPKAQDLLDRVVGQRMPEFADRPSLAYIDAIGMLALFSSFIAYLPAYSQSAANP